MKAFPSLAVVLLLGLHCACAQTLLLEYTFNDSGTTTANSGSLGGSANLVASDLSTATDLHSASGTGVSGQAADKALDLTAATGQGTNYVGPAAIQNVSIGNLQSFTITGWYKASVLGNNTRLFDTGAVSGNNKGISLWMPAANSLNLTVNSTQVGVTSSSLNLLDTWVFFALTYDGTASTNNLKLYVGTQTTAVTAIAATANSAAGAVISNTNPVVIGNQTVASQRPFDGYEDNIRLYGSLTDTSGVLSLAQIESIRALDAVPEPRLASLLLMAFALCAVVRHARPDFAHNPR